MARRPVLHAFFHSMASLGYIPFALTSVLIASSTPYVTLSPIGIILLAFVPPLTMFPLLCFSYRYLERFAMVSLTVQRARIYIMLAGSGLCFLVAAHLLMVHLLGNGYNSGYHQMHRSPPPSIPARPLVPTPSAAVSYEALVSDAPSVVLEQGGSDGSTGQTWMPTFISSILVTLPGQEAAPEDTVAAPSIPVLESGSTSVANSALADTAVMEGAQIEQDLIELISLETMAAPAAESVATTEAAQPVDAQAAEMVNKRKRQISSTRLPPVKSTIPVHLLHPPTAAELEDPARQQRVKPQSYSLQEERDLAAQKPISAEQESSSSLSSSSSLPSSSLEEGVLKMDSAVPDLVDTPLAPSQEQQPQQPTLFLPPLNPFSLLLHPPSVASFPSAPSTSLSAPATGEPIKVKDHPDILFVNSQNPRSFASSYASSGYSIAGLHWMFFIAAEGFLIFLLAILFLGVLILTEFVLDREDEDLVNLTALYWGRIIGIASATIISAVHGSLLSGYVLLDGHSDWIAKAAVGAIAIYWISMTWVMNHVTGPLPY